MLAWSDPLGLQSWGRGLMRHFYLIFAVILLTANTSCAASVETAATQAHTPSNAMHMEAWVKNLLGVHQSVLTRYQKDKDATQAFIDLQQAGIARAIEKQPEGMSKQTYVNMLNDFAYFRYESTAFKTNVPLTTTQMPSFRTFSFVGSERMLRYDDIPNATMRLNRLCEAKHILQKVIKLDPGRTVAYLNLGDVYWRSAQYAQKIAFNGVTRQSANIEEQLQCSEEMKKEGYDFIDPFKDFFNAYDTYKLYQAKMTEQGKAKKIPERVTKLISRKLLYTVVQDADLELGDQNLCIDYEKALNKLSDDEIDFVEANYDPNDPTKIINKRKELAAKGIPDPTFRRGDITRYDASFKRISFDSLPEENRKAMDKNKISIFIVPEVNHPDQVFDRKGNIYVDSRTGYLYMIHTDPEAWEMYGTHSRRCIYEMLNFDKKWAINK